MSSDINGLVSVAIQAESTSPTRDNFGSMLLMGYHTRFTELYRIYGSVGEMLDDGFTAFDDLYRMAASAFSRTDVTVTQVVVGRLPAAPAYNTRLEMLSSTEAAYIKFNYLVPQTGQSVAVSRTIPASSSLGAEATAVAALINDVDVDAIKTTIGSTAGIQTLIASGFDGVIGSATMSPGKRITFTASNHADWDATSLTLTGTDYAGNVQTETLTLPNAGNTTLISTKVYRSVTSLVIPAQSGTGGTATLGVVADVVATVASTKYIDVTPRTAGRQVHFDTLVNTGIEDTTADAAYDTALTALQAEYDGWYFVNIDTSGPTNITKVAAFVAASSSPKLFFAQTNSKAEWDGTGTLATSLASNHRTVLARFRSSAQYGQVSWATFGAANPAGTITFKFASLPGVDTDNISSTGKTNLTNHHVNYYISIKGRPCMTEGVTTFGEYIDIVHGIDALIDDIQTSAFDYMSSSRKNLTDIGLSGLRSVILAAMQRFESKGEQPGLIAEGTSVVTVPKASAISVGDRAARRVTGVRFSGTFAGAVHFVSLSGSLTA